MRIGCIGATRVYSAGNTVTYHVDTGVTYQEEVDEGESCLLPKTFTPSKSEWTFVGWRSDGTPNGNVVSSLAMEDAPITLYAVFRQTITLTYNGNGNTGGSTATQTGTRYWNTGNVSNPSFALSENGFAKSGYTFSKWALDSASGTQYAAGASVALSANATMYAVWVASAHYFTPLNSVTLTIVKDYGTENNLTKSANQIKITARKPENTVAYGELTVSAKIPTRGCKKVRFTATASEYASAAITYNTQQKHFAKTGSPSNVEFDISGDYINITFGVSNGSSYFLAECILTSIYFYN